MTSPIFLFHRNAASLQHYHAASVIIPDYFDDSKHARPEINFLLRIFARCTFLRVAHFLRSGFMNTRDASIVWGVYRVFESF